MTELLVQLVQGVEPMCVKESVSSLSETLLHVQQLKKKRWIWITVAAVLLGTYTIALLFKLPQIYSELKQQTPMENLSVRIVQRLKGKGYIQALAIAKLSNLLQSSSSP